MLVNTAAKPTTRLEDVDALAGETAAVYTEPANVVSTLAPPVASVIASPPADVIMVAA